MARKIIIGILAAVLIGLGVVAYIKTKSKQDGDKEISKTDLPKTPPEKVPEVANDLPISQPEAELETPVPEPKPAAPRAAKAGTGHFEISVPYADRLAQEEAAQYDSLSNAEREKRIRKVFNQKGSLAEKYVRVKSLVCKDTICTMEAEATKAADGDKFQNAIVEAVRLNPWIGNKIDVTTAHDNPKAGRFVFFHEMAK